MKMLFVTEKFPPCDGGSRVYYYNLCANYPPQDVVVFTKCLQGSEEFDKRQRFKIIRKGAPLPNWKYYQAPRMIAPLLRCLWIAFKEKIDVIHCGDFLPAAAIGLFMKKLFGIPYVYYVHGEGNTWYDQYRFQPILRRIFIRNAARIVAACSYAEEGVKSVMSEDHQKVVKITPGVDYERFDPHWKDRGYLESLELTGKRIILTIGRLVERKGQDTVIRALPKVLSKVPDAVYLVGGRGPYEQKLRDLARELHVEDNVRFLGFIPDEKVVPLYSICDIFVMVNRETDQDGPEGFGMVFTEASAAGKPVIGGKSGGTKDSIVDGVTGYRVDPQDVESVADNIIALLNDDSLRQTMGENGRKWVVDNCNWKDKAMQLEQLNLSIVGNRK